MSQYPGCYEIAEELDEVLRTPRGNMEREKEATLGVGFHEVLRSKVRPTVLLPLQLVLQLQQASESLGSLV